MLSLQSSLRASLVTERALPSSRQQIRLNHRTMPKPRPRVKINLDGELKINTDRLIKIHRWKEDKIEKMNKFVQKSFEEVRHLPEGERMPTLQGLLDGYIAAMWGAKLARLRFAAKLNRRHRLKRRADTKLARKTLFWNLVEDMKENKVLRDKVREAREARGELFSFRKFIAEYRESKKAPLVIHDEATFEKFLAEQKEKNFFRGPASSRQPIFKRAGYKHRYKVEVLDPLVYELKRKGFITRLVQDREDKIKAKKVAEELAARRAERDAAKAKRSQEKAEYWGKVLGDWHQENDRLFALKQDYFMAREEVFSQARREFLLAMNNDVNLWNETPDECKFLRFKFGSGVQFPFNRTPYQ